ncbi:RNA polymerase sigma factor [Candidatus Zixiibacteriota bacterium]
MDIESLYASALSGDKSAEEQLFSDLGARFGLFARRKVGDKTDAEDLVQEAIAIIYDKYKATEFEVGFSAWAYTIMKNTILSYYRKKPRPDRHPVQMVEGSPIAASPSMDPEFERKLLTCLKKVATVNRRFARTLNFQFQGYRVAEICDKLGLTAANYYSVLSRARSMLKLCLDKGDIQ